jgi:hypothetical protein
MRATLSLPRGLAPIILVVLAISACTLGPGAFRRVTPAPYYLPDTAASALDVTVSISVGGNALANVGTHVRVLFSVPGHLVAFRAGETLSCDEVAPVALSSVRYGADVEFSTSDNGESHPFSCTYTSQGRASSFAVVIPVAPEIFTPTEGDTLLREQALPVTYQSVTGRAELDAFSFAPSGANFPDTDTSVKITDPNYMALDTSAFIPGPGQIEIIETPTVRVLATGSFHTFTADCGATALIHVTWE